jgi:hypothetical protein
MPPLWHSSSGRDSLITFVLAPVSTTMPDEGQNVNSSSDDFPLALIAGTAAGAIVIVLMVVIVVHYVRSRNGSVDSSSVADCNECEGIEPEGSLETHEVTETYLGSRTYGGTEFDDNDGQMTAETIETVGPFARSSADQ